MKNSFPTIFSLLVLTTLILGLRASNSQDSLLAVYNQSQDSSKISIGIQLTQSLSSTDMPQAINLANEMYAFAQQSKDTKSIARCQNLLGILYGKNMESDISLTFLNQAALNFGKIGAFESLVAVQNNIGQVYFTDGNLIDALDYFFKADSISSRPSYAGKHKTETAVNTATTLTEIGLFELSNDFYKKALTTSGFRSMEVIIYEGLLLNSLEQNQLYSPNKFAEKLKDIEILKSSTDYLEKVLFLAYYDFLSGNDIIGEKGLIEADEILQEIKDKQISANNYLLFAKVLLVADQNQKSLEYALLSKQKLKECKNLYRQKKALSIALLAATKINSPNSHKLATALDSIDQVIIQETGLDILRIVNLQTEFEKMSVVKEQITEESNELIEEISARSKAEKIGIMLIFALVMLGAMLFMAIRQMKTRQKELEEHKRLLKEKHERAKKSHKLKINEKDKLLDIVFTKANDLVVLCKVEQNGDVIVKSINQALELINFNFGLNLEKSQFIGKSLTNIVKDFPFFNADSIEKKLLAAKEALSTKKAVIYETTSKLNSTIINMEVTIEPIVSDDGTANHLLYTLKDISKRVKKERQHIQALLQAEDHERERIAKELHDGLGQNLTAAQLYLDGFLADKEDPNIYDGLFKTRKFLNLGLDECRNLSHNLIPKSIGDIGLSETLLQLITDLNKLNDVRIEFNSNLTKTKIPESISLNLYRIAQEGISNALKYSAATKISVQLLLFEEILTLSIEDNGKGFDAQQMLERKSFGLHSILNRGEIIGADVNLDSKINEGTLISVEIKKPRLG